MIETFTRLEDNSILEISEQTSLLSAEGAYGTSKTREFSYGVFGQAIPLNSSIDHKVFTMVFVSGNSNGQDQKNIERFFSLSDGLYRIEAEKSMGFSLDFYVNDTSMEVFNGKNSVILTCTALYGDFVDESRFLIYQGTIAANGNVLAIQQPYQNITNNTVSVRFTIEAQEVVTWRPNLSVVLRKGTTSTGSTVSTRTGLNNENGVLSAFNGLSYSIDSWDEIVSGYGVINPGTTTYWQVNPGENTSIYVGAFSKPINQSVPLTVKLEAISLNRKTTL